MTSENYHIKRRIAKAMKEILVFLIAACTVIPVLWVIVVSLKTSSDIFVKPLALPNPPQLQNYTEALRIMNLPILLKNTLFVAFVTITVGMLMVILSSFAIARMKFGSGKLQNAFYVFFIAGTIIPVFVLLYPIYMMAAAINTVDTLWSLIMPYWGWTAPVSTLILVGAFKSIPSTLDEAAAMDGCKAWQILFRINLPVIGPSLATSFIINFLGIWNEFPLSSVMLSTPSKYTTALAASMFKGLFTTNYANTAAAVVILMVPQLIVFTFFQRYIVAGVTAGAVKG